MRIFLTGGTGFIGSHFINLAHKAGVEIIAHRRSATSKPRIPLDSEPTWVEGKFSEILPDSLKGCDTLIHLAAHSANVPYDSYENCITQNVIEPLSLFRLAKQEGIGRFLIAGSCFEYGAAGARYDFIPVTAPLEPAQSYPASKAMATITFSAFAREEHLKMLIYRIFHVYGDGELESRFWPSLRTAAIAGKDFQMSEGIQIRDFIPVEFVAQKFLDALSRKDLVESLPLVENLGTGEPKTLKDFAKDEWERFNATGKLIIGSTPMRPNEVMRFVPEISS